MTPFFLHRARRLAAFALLAAPAPVWATIDVVDGAGNIVTMLESDAKVFTDAMLGALAELAEQPSRDTLNFLKGRMSGATIARLEYTYEVNGVPVTRVYHARSNMSARGLINRYWKPSSGSSSAGESGTDTSTSSGGGDGAGADDVAVDIGESRFYPPDTPYDVRATKLPTEGSAVEPRIPEHAWDAEVRLFRRLEQDIDRQIVPNGGNVTGYVSQLICESCGEVIAKFSERHGVHGTMYQLNNSRKIPGVNETGGLSASEADLLEESRAASSRLFSLRKSYIATTLRKPFRTPSVRSWEGGLDTARFAAEEAGELREAAECE